MKQYDPLEELWKSLVKRSSADPYLESFSENELTYFTVTLLEGEIYNGGFDQYFSNSSGNFYREAMAGLEELGANQSLKIARKAAEVIFGAAEPPRDRTKRWDLMRGTQGVTQSARLDELDKLFYLDNDGLLDLLTAYAETHDLTKPFAQEV